MYVNRSIELTSSNEPRFQSFIVFEPSSARINDQDILYSGKEILDLFDEVMAELSSEDTLANNILLNRLNKITQMLDLLSDFDGLVMTKFFDRIWRRYSYISNIGELFIDLPTFSNVFPDRSTDKLSLLAQRIDDVQDDDEKTDSKESDDDSTDSTEDASAEKSKDTKPTAEADNSETVETK